MMGLERETDTGRRDRHTAAKVTRAGGIAIGIVGGADGSGDPGFGDGLGFGNFVRILFLTAFTFLVVRALF